MNALFIGDVICFTCGLGALSHHAPQGNWGSSSSKSLKIDPITGVAVAMAPGDAIVSYEVGNVKLQSQVIRVVGAEKVIILQ